MITTSEYLELLIMKKEVPPTPVSTDITNEVIYKIHEDFVIPLYESMLMDYDNDIEVITEHIVKLYNTSNHFGLIYFFFMLADIMAIELPDELVKMSLTDDFVSAFSESLYESWSEIAD